MNILIIGGATIDIIALVEDIKYIESAEKIDVEVIDFCIGGGGVNASIVLNRLGGKVTLCSAIGGDMESLLFTQKLTSSGIDISNVDILSDEITGRAIITISNNGDTSIIAQRGANLKFDGGSLPSTTNQELVYISSTSQLALERLCGMLKTGYAESSKISFNPSFNQIQTGGDCFIYLCKRVDLIILNQIEATELLLTLGHTRMVNTSPDILGKYLINHGIRATLVTCGPIGAYFTSRDRFYYQAAVPVNAVSALGAGDTFGSTFSYYYFSGRDVEVSANLAATNAASTVSKLDANSGSLTEHQLLLEVSQN